MYKFRYLLLVAAVAALSLLGMGTASAASYYIYNACGGTNHAVTVNGPYFASPYLLPCGHSASGASSVIASYPMRLTDANSNICVRAGVRMYLDSSTTVKTVSSC